MGIVFRGDYFRPPENELTKKQLESYKKETEKLKKEGKWHENS